MTKNIKSGRLDIIKQEKKHRRNNSNNSLCLLCLLYVNGLGEEEPKKDQDPPRGLTDI